MAITIEELELAKKIMFKKVSVEIELEKLTKQHEYAHAYDLENKERCEQFKMERKILLTKINSYKEILLEMPVTMEWRLDTAQRLKANLTDN